MYFKYVMQAACLLCSLLSCTKAVDKYSSKFDKVLFCIFTVIFLVLSFVMYILGGKVCY